MSKLSGVCLMVVGAALGGAALGGEPADKPQGAAAAAAGLQQAHQYFSAECFNGCWSMIDKPDRSPEDVENMLLLAYASLWHWKQRSDCQPVNLSIGYWQLSRVHALAGQYQMARLFADQCLSLSQEQKLTPFYVGYAFEALARAELLHQDLAAAKGYLAQAEGQLKAVTDPEEVSLLKADLTQLAAALAAGESKSGA